MEKVPGFAFDMCKAMKDAYIANKSFKYPHYVRSYHAWARDLKGSSNEAGANPKVRNTTRSKTTRPSRTKPPSPTSLKRNFFGPAMALRQLRSNLRTSSTEGSLVESVPASPILDSSSGSRISPMDDEWIDILYRHHWGLSNTACGGQTIQ